MEATQMKFRPSNISDTFMAMVNLIPLSHREGFAQEATTMKYLVWIGAQRGHNNMFNSRRDLWLRK